MFISVKKSFLALRKYPPNLAPALHSETIHARLENRGFRPRPGMTDCIRRVSIWWNIKKKNNNLFSIAFW